MRTLQITKRHALIFGISWRAFDPYESRHRQITEWRARGHTWAARYALGADSYVGLCNDNFDRPSSGVLYSGAALVASLPRIKGRTALIMLEAEEDVCVVGLINGSVVIDTYGPRTEIGAWRNAFAQKAAEANQEFVTMGSPDSADKIGSIDDTLGWDELVSFGAVAGTFNPAKMQAFKSDRTLYVVIVALLLIPAIAGAYFWYTWRGQQNEKKRIAAIAAANDPKTQYAALVGKLLADPKAISPLSPSLAALRQQLASVPVQLAGWRLVKIHCDLKATGCVSEWKQDVSRVGTFSDFSTAASKQGWTSLVFSATQKQLTARVPFTASRSGLPERALWPTFQHFLADVGSQWQSRAVTGFVVDLKEPTIQAVPPSMQPTVAAASPAATFAASWQVVNKPWWQSEALNHSPAYMTLDQLTLQFTGKEITFSAEGKAYVRKS